MIGQQCNSESDNHVQMVKTRPNIFVKGGIQMALIDNNSILMSVKNLLNVEYDDPAFDTQIGMAINGVFMTLHQIGIGPDEGFAITEANTTWSDFSNDTTLIETVKMYVFMKVRMIFDPPASSIVADAFNSQINELEWRLNVQAERNWKDSENESTEENTLGDAETI